MSEANTLLLKSNLKQLRLPAMNAEFEALAREAAAANENYQQYLEIGQKRKARHALSRASHVSMKDVYYPPAKDTGENLRLSENALAWYAALFAYQQGWLQECMAICDHWENSGYDGDRSYLALRAAYHLSRCEYKLAHDTLQKLPWKEKGTWADNLDKLDKAINDKNHMYRCDPGVSPNLSILVNYQ